MQPYDQQKEDPEGFNLSIGAICGLVAIGSLMSGGPFIAVGLAAGIAAAFFFYRARQAAE